MDSILFNKILFMVILAMTIINLFPSISFRDNNVISIFVPLLIVKVVDVSLNDVVISYLNGKEGFKWTFYLWVSLGDAVLAWAIIKRDLVYKFFFGNVGFRKYRQEYILAIIFILYIPVSMSVLIESVTRHWLDLHDSKFFFHMYKPLKRGLLVVENVILVTLTIQNIIGLLSSREKRC